ncbi:hypothetical protein HPA24_04315 [Streptococcus suis]|uniref:hypothetical protein n=1 Tax=Streptococcus suis TaxID=1307 RepID=UPI0005CF064F|nr:hypothetical protein [Streptococcus suis]NQG33722.1 hypothetical protein [Streptococcus suis]NQM89616.1 hypothetical protein [Streptococcus suis]NQM95581.1 hypothetical protein [Streptococcus suis]NQN06714.1 hypothetical protein [Streptococcus suis]NQN08909.1 hypothetical protein [Streptococcus suis]
MEGLDKVKRVILKNLAKQDKPYIREIRHLTTGFDIFYGNEQQAFRYATWAVGVDMARSLYLRGNFKIIEVED